MSDICVCSHHPSIAQLLDDAEFRALAHRPGFLVELRLDQYGDLNVANLTQALNAFAPEVVVTHRHPAEGGHNPSVSDEARLAWLQQAADHGVKLIDIEARTARAGFRKGAAKLILSFHDFQKVPALDVLMQHWRSMSVDSAVDVIKIACNPATIFDTAPLLEILLRARNEKRQAVILGMGEAGFWTRVAGALFGAPFAFSRSENALGTAPGQPTWRELEELYHFRQIKPDWPVYGVIGNPIAHSLSPLMHNTALQTLGIPGVYIPFKVEGDPALFVKTFAPLGLQGISVTIPHKEAVRAACSKLDNLAQTIGAVNTLRRTANGWEGSNTDAAAAADSLEQAAGSLRGKHVLIIGAGGAARAVAFGVKERGAETYILNRTKRRAESLASDAGAAAVSYEQLPSLAVDAIVNATPLGMHPNTDETPLSADQIPKGSILFDTVYNPLRTKLLRLAEACGCRTVVGLSMFIGQGARQFELWTGRPAPRKLMEQSVLAVLKERESEK